MVLFRGAETHTRSVLKALSWRTLGTLDTFAISWILTGRVEIAGSIAGLEIITKIAWSSARKSAANSFHNQLTATFILAVRQHVWFTRAHEPTLH